MQPWIYLDFNATTPILPDVGTAMSEALANAWGNPSSEHEAGYRARETVESARREVAALLHARPSEVVFTSGGTESDNLALFGVTEALANRGRHIVTTAIEHPAIEGACQQLERRGFEVARVVPDRNGRVAVEAIEEALRDDTILVSVMHANNETGVIQPIEEIARAAKLRGAIVHSDAAQSVGKIETDVEALDVDLLTVAGHKLYGPKGIGALFVRRGIPLAPQLFGGGQEGGLRPGTEPIPAIAGLGAACAVARQELGGRAATMTETRDRLERALVAAFPGAVVHGAGAARLPNTLSIALPGKSASMLLARLEGVAASAGAACHAGHDEPSRVLLAMGVSPEAALRTIRFSTGRSTTAAEIDLTVGRILAAAGLQGH